MKKFMVILTLVTLTASSVFGGIAILTDTIPPLELPVAYPIAVKALGTNAPQCHCVMAMPMCSQNYFTNHLSGEWSFNFLGPNSAHTEVWVFFDDHTAAIVNIPGF
jgi:hypothetical protein